MKIQSSIISREQAIELLRSASEHVQVVEEGCALHLVIQDGVTYVVNELTLEEATRLHAKVRGKR